LYGIYMGWINYIDRFWVLIWLISNHDRIREAGHIYINICTHMNVIWINTKHVYITNLEEQRVDSFLELFALEIFHVCGHQGVDTWRLSDHRIIQE
jgi:hypothetical protein